MSSPDEVKSGDRPAAGATRPGGIAARIGGRLADWAGDRRGTLVAVFTLAMLIVAAWALMRLASETSYAAIVGALRATEPWRVAVAVLLTVASFGLLTLYDLNAFASIGKPQPWRRIAPGAVAAYAVAQTAGFGPLSGGAVRLRYYTPLGVTPADIARVVVFVVAAFGLGLTLTAAAGGLVAAPHLAAVLGVRTATVGVVAAAVLAAALVLIAGAGRGFVVPGTEGRRFELPGRMLMIRQLAVTALDTAAAGGVLWVLLPAHTVSYAAFLPIYAVALALGILSHVPAGLGVFEAVMLAALSGLAPPAEILAAFALYRLIYQVLPLAVAAAGLALAEGRALAAHGPTAAALKAVAGLAPPVLATMALVLGTMLVFSGVTPAQPDDLDWLGSFLPLHVIEGAHFLASVLGALLLISARGLAFRADGAWWAAMVAACAALVLSLLKAVAVYEAAALALFAAALFVARGAFDRRSALFGLRLTPPWIAAVAVVLVSAFVILRFVFDHAEFGAESWLRFELSAEAPRGQRALFGASLFACLFALWSLLRPVRDAGVPLTDADLERAIAIIAAQPVAGANLVRMGDKRLLLSTDGRAFVMYGRQGNSWIALYDPVGPVDAWEGLIWRFVETARNAGCRAAFYQVAPERLAIYADAGMRFFKLGEQARVDLSSFELTGKARASQRNVLSRGAREGLAVELVEPAAVPPLLDALEAVSDAWLRERGGVEKGFSLGAFDRAYVGSQRLAVMRMGGEVVAFATLMAGSGREETAIDLMRHVEAIPNVGMEFLFLRICEMLKDEGWHWFDLGMAPLSGFSESEAAPAWHRVGRAIYEQGVFSYNFKGLRGFKSKLQPEWRPRYLAIAGGANPALVLLDATRLIARSARDGREG